jgi:hypothetical protein
MVAKRLCPNCAWFAHLGRPLACSAEATATDASIINHSKFEAIGVDNNNRRPSMLIGRELRKPHAWGRFYGGPGVRLCAMEGDCV